MHMYKQAIATAVILFLAIGVSQAQVSLKGKVGLNFSNLSENPEGTEISGNAGYQFGGSLLIGNKFYIEPGFQMVRNSRDFVYRSSQNYEFKVTENWMKVPVHVGYHIAGDRRNRVSLRIFAGPSISTLQEFSSEDELEVIVKDKIKDARWAVDAGLGLDILFLFVEFNYEYSLNKYSTEAGFNGKHGAYVVNAGARLNF